MFTEKLCGRLRATPLFTHYDGTIDSRVELSGTTFSNWVDRTVNMLDGLGVGVGEPVRLDLMNTDLGYWVVVVWVATVWQHGCPVVEQDGGDAVLAVIGSAGQIRGPVTVICSLRPLGLGLVDLPAGCTDYADVLVEPDVHWEEPVPPGDLAWLSDVTRTGPGRLPGSDQ